MQSASGHGRCRRTVKATQVYALNDQRVTAHGKAAALVSVTMRSARAMPLCLETTGGKAASD